MFMVHFMCAPNRFKINVVRVSKNFKPLVNKNVMNQEISHAVQSNSHANPKKKIITIHPSKKQAGNAWQRKNDKEEIIVFYKTIRFFFMMVFVQFPQYAMHDVFVCKPGNAFHTNKGRHDNNGFNDDRFHFL